MLSFKFYKVKSIKDYIKKREKMKILKIYFFKRLIKIYLEMKN